MIEVSITYPIHRPDDFEISGNVKDNYVICLLTDWLHDQIGKGKDFSVAVDRNVYHIRIQVDLSQDIFYVDSDTGNKGLTTGIIMDVISRLDKRDKCPFKGGWSNYEI
jgi:hypothetical protein